MKRYVIWSHEHKMWWAPDMKGYTPHVSKAGKYQRDQAIDITFEHIPYGEEVAVEYAETGDENFHRRYIWRPND